MNSTKSSFKVAQDWWMQEVVHPLFRQSVMSTFLKIMIKLFLKKQNQDPEDENSCILVVNTPLVGKVFVMVVTDQLQIPLGENDF